MITNSRNNAKTCSVDLAYKLDIASLNITVIGPNRDLHNRDKKLKYWMNRIKEDNFEEIVDILNGTTVAVDFLRGERQTVSFCEDFVEIENELFRV